jgi:hypothetical protein
VPIFRFSGLLRLARLSRLSRITRLMRTKGKREITQDVLQNRGRYAAAITLMAAFLVLVVASVLELAFESGAPNANITTGGDALWWAVVTITTVGYGDFYPVTAAGRITGVFVMFTGIGIIGALASILASILVAPTTSPRLLPRDPPTWRMNSRRCVTNSRRCAPRSRLAAATGRREPVQVPSRQPEMSAGSPGKVRPRPPSTKSYAIPRQVPGNPG